MKLLDKIINMKWIQPELYWMRDVETNGQMDRRTDGVKPIYLPQQPSLWGGGYNDISQIIMSDSLRRQFVIKKFNISQGSLDISNSTLQGLRL